MFSSALPQIVNILSNLILPGLIIARFGSDMNGLVSTTKTIISYISLVGAGIATAVTQALYQPVANHDDTTTKGILLAANNMFNRYGFLFVAITIVVSGVYPFFIDSDIPYMTIVCLLFVMSLSGASEFFAIGRCRALLYAHQKVYVCTTVQAVSLLLSLIFAVILLHLNAGILFVQFAISFVYVLRGFFLTAYIKNFYPQYSNYKSAEPVAAAIAKRKDAMVHQLAGLVVTGSQTAILTMLVDLKAASIYSVYNIVLYGIRNICSNLCTAITPFFGKKYALQRNEELKNMYAAVEFVFFFFVTFVLMVTTVMIIPFVSLYTVGADTNYIYPVFALLFVLSSSFYILKLPGTALINVAGHFKETKWRAIAEASLSLSLSIVFTILLGKEGVLIGSGIALGWRCVDTIIYSSKYVLKCSFKRSMVRLSAAIVNIFAFKALANQVQITIASWQEWIMMGFACSAAAFAVLAAESVLFERKSLKLVGRFFSRKRNR